MAIGTPPNAPRGQEGSKGAAGRYGFVAEVARGYLGTLFVARDPSDGSERGTVFVRHVVPISTSSAKAALIDAARWAHATGAPTLEILENRNGVDLVTAYSDVEPLRALLRTAALKHTTVEPGIILAVVLGLLEQLDAAHDAASGQKSPHGYGGVHPDSILVGTDGHVELIDCGLGSAASAREPWRSDPQRIGYAAPEQVDPKGVVDARTDVFSLGVLLWEAFANKRLFPAVDAKSARDRVLKGVIPRLDATKPTPSAPAEVATFVAKALERDPAARFQSVEEMESSLKKLGPATPAALGAWVTALGDQAIAKRKQILERLSVGSPPPDAGRASVPPKPRLSVPPASTRPSVAPKPSSAPPSSRPPEEARQASGPPSSKPPEDARRASVPPRPAEPALTPKAPDATSPTPAVPHVEPAPSHDEGLDAAPPSAAKKKDEPAPPSAPTERSAAPPPVATPAPASVEAVSAPENAAETAAATASAETAAATATASAETTASAPASGEPTQASGEPTQASSTDGAPAEASRDSNAAIPANDDGDDTDAMDVSDEELGAPPAPPPRASEPPHSGLTRTSLPPRLPPSQTPQILGAPTEPLASPFGAPSDFARLTRAPAKKRRPALLVGGALVVGLAVGFFVLGRMKKKQPLFVPYKEEAVAGSVQIIAQEPVPGAGASASAAPAAASAPAPAPTPSATPEPAPPAPEAPAPGAPKEPAGPSAGSTQTSGGSTSGATPAGLHKPPPTRGPVNSGYKPGGI